MAASLPFCFPEEFKTRCYRFSAINEGSSATCQMCCVEDVHEAVWMQAPCNTWEANDTPYFSPPHAGPQTHPVLTLSPACQPSSLHIFTQMLYYTSNPTSIIPCFFHHLYTCTHMCSLIPRHPFTHLHFLLHPHSLWHCFPYNGQQLLHTHSAGTLSCSPGSHVLCLWIPHAVVRLLLVQFSLVFVLSDTHLQSSGPEHNQHVFMLKMNMPGTSLFSKLTLWYQSPQGDQSVV